MYTLKALVATVAVMAGLATAQNVTNPPTTFTLQSFNPGCVAKVVSAECGLGCESIVVLSDTQNCDQLSTLVTGPACNGIVSIDFSPGHIKSAYFEEDLCRSTCILVDDTCTSQ